MAAKPSSLKIGLVLDDSLDKTDGVQQYVLSIGQWLMSQGHDVHYLVGQTTRQDLNNLHSLSRNVSVSFNRNRLSIPLPTSKAKLAKLLQNEQFDVLHIQMPYSPWLAARIINNAPSCTAIFGTFHILPHSKLVKYSSKFLSIWNRKSAKRFDGIVSVSPAAQEFAKSVFGIKSTVLPNVLDYKLFNSAKRLPDYDDNIITIMFLGRLVARKGCLTLLKAIDLLSKNKTLPDYRVVICGKGPLMERLKAFVATKSLGDKVSFIGFVSEELKPRYYASADISVFPSTGGESFGIVLIEAMASGSSVVLAGDNPGYHSVLGAKTELLFDPHRPDQLAELLAEYLTNKTKRDELRDWAEIESSKYDTGKVGQQLVSLYDQALRKRRQL